MVRMFSVTFLSPVILNTLHLHSNSHYNLFRIDSVVPSLQIRNLRLRNETTWPRSHRDLNRHLTPQTAALYPRGNPVFHRKSVVWGASLEVNITWTSTAGGLSSIPGQKTKIPHLKKKEKKWVQVFKLANGSQFRALKHLCMITGLPGSGRVMKAGEPQTY